MKNHRYGWMAMGAALIVVSIGLAGAADAAGAGGPSKTGTAKGSHPYFDSLVARRDVVAAYPMRSQAELDKLKSGGVGPKKLPVVYDPVMDAACFMVDPTVSTDSQQKHLAVKANQGSLLFTWDFRFDKNFAWKKDGDLTRHKTWRFDGDKVAWLAMKTDYILGAKEEGKVAELFFSLPSPKTAGPGTERGRIEIIFPRKAQFFIQPDKWSRVWVLLEGIDKPNCHLSAWAADEENDPVQLYDHVALVPPEGGLTLIRMEYDTSQDKATNTEKMRSWNRNFVVLKNPPAREVQELLKRPKGQ